MAAGMAHRGADTRTWVSYGTVDDDEPVVMDPDLGPLVAVTLQPLNVSARCRVLMQSAGKGEAEYVPFVAGDEVLVALPEGSTWSAPCILGRLCNSIDKFPTGSVAGQDPSKNNFAFKRTRTAWIHEVEGGYLIREAVSGSFVQLDKGGTVTLRDGSKGALQMSKDVFGYQSGDGKFLVQQDLGAKRFTAKVDDALLTIAASSSSSPASAVVAPGTFSISAGAQPANEHAVSTEAVVNLVLQILSALGTSIPAPITGAALVAWVTAGSAAAGVTAAAGMPLNPLVAAAIQGGFALMGQKPPGAPSVGQSLPGIGCPAIFVG